MTRLCAFDGCVWLSTLLVRIECRYITQSGSAFTQPNFNCCFTDRKTNDDDGRNDTTGIVGPDHGSWH
jgi:hypothetical protein